MNTRSVSES